jgi:catechol 2,3-dioxygenase-like lactoylglutathione lyase family enzyme
MGLSDYAVNPAIAVSDMDRAREFYEGKLGLSGGGVEGDGGVTYDCAGGTSIHIFPSENAGGSGATVAGWDVDDLEALVDELSSAGVSFESYDQPPLTTNEKGIATIDGDKVAWFKDPDGNVMGLVQS